MDRIVQLERLSESLAKELRTPAGGDEVLSPRERRLVNGAHKGWGILARARHRRARRRA